MIAHYRSSVWFMLALLLPGCGVVANTAAMSAPTAVSPAAESLARSGGAGADQGGTPAAANAQVQDCPITRPPDPAFTPPSPYPRTSPSPTEAWYGTEALWTAIPKTGVWSELPHTAEGYSQKVFWWRDGYSWADEPEPKLAVIGRRLDSAAPPLRASRATNAFADDIQSAMLVGIDIPTSGCWEITAQYAGTSLGFVVWVAP